MTTHPALETLSLEDKARLCSGLDFWHLEGVESAGLDAVVITDGPHGLRKQLDQGAGIKGAPATCFPTASAQASSWDRTLLHDIGAALGREARNQDVAVVLGPGINIKRHPLCGRNFEYFSEDPFLTGELASANIDGIQSVGVGTSIKHYAVNNQESHRMVVDAIVDERTLREIYFAGFERAITASKPWTVMCAYNRLNGTYCSESRWLLTDVLRDEWGFEGIVMTDWGATNDRVDGVVAGLDLEMPGSGGVNDAEIVAAVQAGRLAEADLDIVANRMLHLIERSNAAVAEPLDVDIDEHHRLAQRAAAETIVMLTNDGALPLAPQGDIAVIGAFAETPRYQGAGSSLVNPTKLDRLVDTVADALNEAGTDGAVRYSAGYDPKSDDARQDLIDEAVLVARSAPVAVVVVGLPGSYESEAFDRAHMRLPEQHNELVKAVCAVNDNTIVVLCNGSAVQLPWVDQPRAILEANLGGQGGAKGISDVLFGKVNPSGKLAETFAIRQSDHASDAWFPGTIRQVQYREGLRVGYRWFDAAKLAVLFPFGHGLSYTTFDYSNLTITGSSDADAADFAVTATVTVTNTGPVAGAEVVQLYVRDVETSVERPEQELKGFDKVFLNPGESANVSITLDRRAFAFYAPSGEAGRGQWVVESGEFEVRVGASSRDIRATGTVSVTSTSTTAAAVTPAIGSDRSFDTDEAFTALLGRPIPEPAPTRPFHRTSTIGEVAGTPAGALLHKAMEAGVRKQMGDDDEDVALMVAAGLVEAPLRSSVLFSSGKVSWQKLDKLIATLNTMDKFSLRRLTRRK